MSATRQRREVIGVPIDILDWETAEQRVVEWARTASSRYVCACNVHSTITAAGDDSFKRILGEADLTVPDGMPVAWALRRQGAAAQPRIDGPGLMWRLCARAESESIGVGFYGSTDATLSALRRRLTAAFPALKIGAMEAPPFRTLEPAEDDATVDRLNASASRILFVGLGCPKQERWMAEHRGRVQAVMIGVGAAFDFHAGTVARAPRWMQESGLEWLYRLVTEPRRLWRRYLVGNAAFVVKLVPELVRHWLSPRRSG